MKKSLVLGIALLLLTGLSLPALAQRNALGNMAKQMAVASVLDMAAKNPKLSTFVMLAKAAGLTNSLGTAQNPVTLLAPTNEAFAALGKGAVERLMKPENKSELTGILQNHLLTGALSAGDLGKGNSQKSQLGNVLQIAKTASGALNIGGANVVEADQKGSTGMMHLIDKVLVPAK